MTKPTRQSRTTPDSAKNTGRPEEVVDFTDARSATSLRQTPAYKVLRKRKPMLLLRFVGSFLLRFAERVLFALFGSIVMLFVGLAMPNIKASKS